MDRITVLIADDHAVVRQGLKTFLEMQDGIEVVGEAANGQEAVIKARDLVPEVVLMDLVMPLMDGITAIREIKTISPSTRVIVLTSFVEDDKVFPAIKAGAVGYLMKDVSPEELTRAIRLAHRGEALLHPEVAKRLMQEFHQPHWGETVAQDLTEREVEVLRLVAKGMSNRDIADHLVLSEKTVKTHVSNILQKLHLSDRTQAALYAVKQRLVSLD